MPEGAIIPGNFSHRAYRKSKREEQVCPRKRFLREISVTGHTRKASKRNRYARGSDNPGKFQSLGIPGKQAREIGMPEEAIIPGNFNRRAYRKSKRGKQVCPRERFLREISVTGHTGKASERNRYARGSDFPGKFLTRGIPEKQAKNKSMKSKRKDELI